MPFSQFTLIKLGSQYEFTVHDIIFTENTSGMERMILIKTAILNSFTKLVLETSLICLFLFQFQIKNRWI